MFMSKFSVKCFFVTQRGRRGTIEMTLVHLCVRYSVHPSIHHISAERSCPRNSSYIFHGIHLKFCRLSSYDMKMCLWFWNFDSNIFDGVFAHADINFASHDLVSLTPSTSFIGFIWNFVDFLPMIWRCACDFRILIPLFLTEFSPMLT